MSRLAVSGAQTLRVPHYGAKTLSITRSISASA
jgi:hypothetical protein